MISYYTKGGFTKGDLDKMPFDEFEIVLKEVQRIEKLLNPKDSQ